MIHDNPTRNKQKKTKKENQEGEKIRLIELAKLNQRRIEAENHSDYAALRRLVFDYLAIELYIPANYINKDLPTEYKVLATEM